ncbi:hypothetical protein [Actinomadura algeriensis]|uniref:Uncharacterized protein n=1 Tax=Actinomadura algeriensis TaxID=1679523 RepID=A0ABR9JLX0_9ACTN|nr:hypothetical protein [Actinomadura algeriensis]MBE1531423.1 hypothetical protein [Actinomadura algeriensis]
MTNAEVLHRFGDPDLAVASADCAIRQYLNKSAEINASAGGSVHIDRFRRAIAIASELHAAGGRLHLALQVDDMAVRAAGLAGATRGAARAREAVHLRADGRTREADELARDVHGGTDAALADDLAGRLRGVVLKLRPFAPVDAGVAAVVEECHPFVSSR